MKTNPYAGHWSVGFDSILDQIEKYNTQSSNYPPHNLIKYSDESFAIEVAVAGFNEDDLTVEQDQNTLTISSVDVEAEECVQYAHKGIATRKFEKKFTLGEFIEVTEVSLINGILSILLEKNIPEEKRPKTFAINSETRFLQG